jgi:undecaprenyl-diphosphatase
VARPADAAALARAASSSTEELLSWWQAAILGIVEGITEYLPISSTGHLLVVSRLLGLPDQEGSAGLEAVNTYAIAIQFGAILAVLGLFWKRFRDMVMGLFGKNPDGLHLLVTLVIAFLPAAILGVLFDNAIEDALFGPWPIVAAWIAGGVLILVLERTGRIPDRGVQAEVGHNPLAAITYRQALIIGLAQCVALWPGTSRSLATILGALLVGVAMPAAVEFSFLLGFATLSAATAFKLVKDGGTLVDQFGVINPLIGALFAFVAAVLAIRWLITYLERHDLSIFAWYRFGVAAIAVALLAGGVI